MVPFIQLYLKQKALYRHEMNPLERLFQKNDRVYLEAFVVQSLE